MVRILYVVTAMLPDEALAEAYLAWLTDGHVAEVVAAGAERGDVVRLDVPQTCDSGSSTVRIQTCYVFPSRETFETYCRDHAPRLQAEGRARFGRARGVRFTREVGVLVHGESRHRTA